MFNYVNNFIYRLVIENNWKTNLFIKVINLWLVIYNGKAELLREHGRYFSSGKFTKITEKYIDIRVQCMFYMGAIIM